MNAPSQSKQVSDSSVPCIDAYERECARIDRCDKVASLSTNVTTTNSASYAIKLNRYALGNSYNNITTESGE